MRYIYFGLSFGLTMAASLYVLYNAGLWLDAKYQTEPLFSLVGIIFAVVLTFKSLIDKLNIIEKMDKKNKDNI